MSHTDRRELLKGAGRLAAAAGAAGAGAKLAAAAEAASSATRPPNILILMTDQERHRDRLPDHLPLPVRCWLDENGTNIDRFHSSSMACTPARGTLWTGMNAPQQGMYGTFIVGLQFTMDPSIPTIGDLLKEQGYRTAFFGKWHLSFPGDPPTNPEATLDTAQGNPLKGYGFDDSAISPPSDTGPYNDGYTNDPIWTGQAVNWLRAHAADSQPWFCVLSLLNPHDIQFYPRGFRADFKRPDYDVKLDRSFYEDSTLKDKPSAQLRFRDVVRLISGGGADADQHPEEYFRTLHNIYYDLIVGTDEMLGAALKAVNDAGALDNTVVIRTADHGELAGAHRLQNKGITIYDEQNRIPFTAVYSKRFPRGAKTQALGEQVDLVPTCLELAGVADPLARYPWLRGRSLVKALENPDKPGPRDSILYRIDEFAITGVGTEKPVASHIRSLYDGRYKVARYAAVENGWFAGKELTDPKQEFELYDTWEDPYEIRNLANDPGYESLFKEMLAWLAEREKDRWGPVNLPEYGPPGLITELPVIPNIPIRQGGLPSPFVVSKPGSYLVVPINQPTPLRFLYEGNLPNSLGSSSSDPARAADMARFFCQLAPSGVK